MQRAEEEVEEVGKLQRRATSGRRRLRRKQWRRTVPPISPHSGGDVCGNTPLARKGGQPQGAHRWLTAARDGRDD